jgi:hypothetical protein
MHLPSHGAKLLFFILLQITKNPRCFQNTRSRFCIKLITRRSGLQLAGACNPILCNFCGLSDLLLYVCLLYEWLSCKLIPFDQHLFNVIGSHEDKTGRYTG